MKKEILAIAKKLDKASKAHAGQAKLLKSLIKNGKSKKRR